MAALYVVIHHSISTSATLFGLNVAYLFRFGEEAVILFFLLSGFVINFSFANTRDKTFRTYFFKRATRIYIPLLIVMMLGYVMECYDAGEVVNAHPVDLLLNLLMLQDISSLKPNVVVDPYMHNSPLWSLSYEWWFYMVYFLIQKQVDSNNKKDAIVFCLSMVSALTYVYFPTFLPRLLMYMGIWWLGVVLSNKYMNKEEISLGSLAVPLSAIGMVMLVCGFGVYRASGSATPGGAGVHPLLEMRDQFSALVIVVVGILWKSQGWIFFDRLVKPFLVFAPISYVIYISHYYFLVMAHYFSFVENQALEFIVYIMMMLAFSYIVEIIIYPKILRKCSALFMAPARVAETLPATLLSASGNPLAKHQENR